MVARSLIVTKALLGHHYVLVVSSAFLRGSKMFWMVGCQGVLGELSGCWGVLGGFYGLLGGCQVVDGY